MRKIPGILIAALLSSGGAQAELSVGAGTEHMDWREYDPLTEDKLLAETGLRFFATAEASHPVDEGIDMAYSAKLYGGEVDYDGAYQDGTPVTSETGYSGTNVEVRGLFFPATPRFRQSARTAVALGLGLDTWTRNIKGPGGYEEEYTLSYVRLGVEQDANRGNPWSARVGVLHPIDIKEQVYLLDGVELKPKAKPSFYLSIGYHFVPEWQLDFDYHSYRFGASDPETLTYNGEPVDISGDGVADQVLQPRSELDIYSVTLRHLF